MKNLYLFILGLCFFGWQIPTLQAQDPMYSQYFSGWLRSNPAMTATYSGLTFQSILRDQWRVVQFNRSKFTTGSLNATWFAGCLRSGFGFFYDYNTEGEGNLRTTSFGLSWAYIVPLVDNKTVFADLRFGLSLGQSSRQINWDNLVFTGQLDPFFGIVTQNQSLPPEILRDGYLSYFDVSSGMVYQYYHNESNIGSRIGIAAHHLNKPDASLLGNSSPILPWRWTAHASIAFEEFLGRKRLSLTPGIKVDWQRSSTLPGFLETNPDAFVYRSINFGVMLSNLPNTRDEVNDSEKSGVYGGLWLHTRNLFPDNVNTSALIGMVGTTFQIGNVNYNLGLSGDYYFQGAGPGAGWGAEVSLTVNFPDFGQDFCPINQKSYKPCRPHKSKYPLPVNF